MLVDPYPVNAHSLGKSSDQMNKWISTVESHRGAYQEVIQLLQVL